MKIKYLLVVGFYYLLFGPSSAKAESLNYQPNNQISLNSQIINNDFDIGYPKKIQLTNSFSWDKDLSLEGFSQTKLRSRTNLASEAEKKQKILFSKQNKGNYYLAQITEASYQPSEVKNTVPSTLSEAEFRNYQTTSQSLQQVSTPNNYLTQLTNVSQLRDVQAGDWAYEALRNLVERYGCIVGYPNSTFGGNQALSRYEFAAGLNACLNQMERLIAASEQVRQDDLETIKKLAEEFQAELAAIKGRVDNLEGQVAFLEDHQFSTTTILNGEVIFALADAFGGDPPGGCEDLELNLQNGQTTNIVNCGLQQGGNQVSTADDPETNTTFVHLTRIGLQTSFTGKDRLRTFLTTGNFDNGGFTNPESLNTNMARLSYQAGLENQVILDLLEYRFPVLDDRVVISVVPFGFSLSDVLTANSPYFDIGRGAISRFGQLSPIYRIGGVLDAGAGFDWLITDAVRLQVAYGTADSGDPEQGVSRSDHSSLGVQLLLQPFERLTTGITYVNSYNSDGVLGTFTGSVNAETNGNWSGGRLPAENFATFPGAGIEIGDLAAQTNAVGGTLQLRITEKLTFGASGAYTFTNFLEEIPDFPQNSLFGVAGEKPFGNTVTYMFSLGLSDPFGREGDLFAFLFGMPPKLVDAGPVAPGQSVPFFEQAVRDENPVRVTDNDPRAFLDIDPNNGDSNNGNLIPQGTAEQFGREDEATSLHFEFFYRFKVSDNVSITPGFFFVTNPGHIEDNDTIYVGTIRTTFRF